MLHKATDRRCYNGSRSPDLEKELQCLDKLHIEIKEHCQTYQCTFFPAEAKWMSFVGHKFLTGRMFSSKGDCLNEAHQILVQGTSQ